MIAKVSWDMFSMYPRILVHGHMPMSSVIVVDYLMKMDIILTRKRMFK